MEIYAIIIQAIKLRSEMKDKINAIYNLYRVLFTLIGFLLGILISPFILMFDGIKIGINRILDETTDIFNN